MMFPVVPPLTHVQPRNVADLERQLAHCRDQFALIRKLAEQGADHSIISAHAEMGLRIMGKCAGSQRDA